MKITGIGNAIRLNFKLKDNTMPSGRVLFNELYSSSEYAELFYTVH